MGGGMGVSMHIYKFNKVFHRIKNDHYFYHYREDIQVVAWGYVVLVLNAVPLISLINMVKYSEHI